MRKLLLMLALALSITLPATAQITVPNTLVAGATIRAAELNTNFSTLGDKALNRLTGGQIEGNITILADVTIDGVDISDFLLSTGEVRTQTAGVVGTPAYSRTGDTGTGMWFPAASQLSFSLGGVEKLKLDANGVTTYGVNLINSAGKLQALTDTYLANLSGASLTALNATEVTSGTLPDARLSANVPRLNGTQSFSATNTFTYAGVEIYLHPGSAPAANTKMLLFTNAVAADKFWVDYEGDAYFGGQVEIVGFKMATGAANTKVLTSDATGVGTWQDPGVASGTVPSGAIMMFQTTCPTTWTRMAAWDNKFVRGAPTYGGTGGSDSHSHSVDPPSTASGAAGSHSHTTDPLAVTSAGGGSHGHSWGSVNTDNTNIGHEHGGSTANDGSHSHGISSWHGDVQSGTGANPVESVDTSTGNAGSHNHTFTTGTAGGLHGHWIGSYTTDTQVAHTHSVDVGVTTSSSDGLHDHATDIGVFSSAAASTLPAYIEVIFCKKD